MTSWILSICVDETSSYWYEVDRAFETLRTIPQAQNKRIKNISVGDSVYVYETYPVQKIGWKCEVVDIKIAPQDVDIDDKKFEHGEDEPADSYIKITAIGKYNEESRKKLSLDELRKNGLKSNLQGAERVKPQLLNYINSIKFMVL